MSGTESMAPDLGRVTVDVDMEGERSGRGMTGWVSVPKNVSQNASLGFSLNPGG